MGPFTWVITFSKLVKDILASQHGIGLDLYIMGEWSMLINSTVFNLMFCAPTSQYPSVPTLSFPTPASTYGLDLATP